MTTNFKTIIAIEERQVSMNRREDKPDVYQVHIDFKYIGDLYYRGGQWNIDNSSISYADKQSLGKSAKQLVK